MPRMKRGQKVTNKQCEKALMACCGLIGAAARCLKITYAGLYRRIQNEPELQKVLEKARETVVETAEAQLFAHVERGEWDAIKFVLERLGKHKGYNPKLDVSHSGEVHLHFDKQDKGL